MEQTDLLKKWSRLLQSTILISTLTFTSFTNSLFAQNCSPSSGEISGIVYGDYNMNGLNDQVSAGFEDINVQLYASDAQGNGVLTNTVQTDANGRYTFTGLSDGTTYRVEFIIPNQDNFFEGFAGADSGTSIQFITAPSCDSNLGIAHVADYCQDNPLLIIPCYVNGDPLPAGASSGAVDAAITFNFNDGGTTPPSTAALSSEIGSTFGVATKRTSMVAYASAFLKRHVGLGSLGLGGIYEIDLSSGTGVTTSFLDVASIGINVGSIPSNSDRGLPTNEVLPSNDPDAYDAVGKIGIGGLDLSDDESTLWLVNLFDRTLYSISVDSDGNPATPPTAADVNAFSIPDPGCNNGDFRPFAVKYHRDKVYVGVICDASTGSSDDLEAIVYELDNGSFTNVLQFDLNYDKGRALRSCTDETGWFPWTDTFPMDCTGNGDYVYPSPILSALEFDVDNSLILGFMDRTGNQLGFLNYTPTGDDANIKNTTGGDILRAASNTDGTYTIENNGTSGGITTGGANNNEGPGGGEYYYFDVFTNNLPPALYPHSETSQGGLVLIPGTGEVVTSALDPFGTTVNSGGVNFLNNQTGEIRDPGLLLFSSGSVGSGTFGKANGLGDVDVFCEPAPLEIGNYVWLDVNENGVQDPSESPLVGINITLFDNNGNALATVQTDANGQYVFNNMTAGLGELTPNTTYYIVAGTGGQFNTSTSALNDSLQLTSPNLGTGVFADGNDSDAELSTIPGTFSGLPTICIQTGNAGENNHTYDFGFIVEEIAPMPDAVIRGKTFKDCDQDGINNDDFVFPNIKVHLDGTITATTTSDNNGNYEFTNLPAGDYKITFEIPTASGVSFTLQNQGNNDTIDSDVNPSTGMTATFSLAQNQIIENIDAGFADTEAPTIINAPSDITVTCSEIPPVPTLTATDNCDDDVDIQFVEIDDVDDCISMIKRVWVASDECLNSTVHEQYITIIDNTPPVFVNPPTDATLECDILIDPVQGDIEVTDDCSDVNVVLSTISTNSDCEYTVTNTWTATDACGNSTTHTQTILTTDTEGPTITYNNPLLNGLMNGDTLTVECDNPPVLGENDVTVTDNCDDNPHLTFEDFDLIEGNCLEDGYILLMTCGWTATDNCGNSTVLTIYVKVIDSTPPVITNIPDDISVHCEDQIPSFGSVYVSDNCSNNNTLTYEDSMAGNACHKQYIRTWTATDHCGNTSTASQIITVIDDTPPVFTYLPPHITLDCTALPPNNPATATDNCSEVTITFEETTMDGDCSYSTFITRTWIATDACGNSDTYNQFISFDDTTPPTIYGVPSDITVECGEAYPDPSTFNISATDNCDADVTINLQTVETTDINCATGGPSGITYIFTATDDCGNSATASFSANAATDNTPPTISGVPSDITIDCGEAYPDPYSYTISATDNCDTDVDITIEKIETTDINCATGEPNAITYIFTATDNCGNSATASFSARTAADNTPPTISGVPSDITIDCGEAYPDPSTFMVSATDNCDTYVNVEMTAVETTDINCATGGPSLIVYTWTAIDNCGNSATATMTVSAGIDNTPPVFLYIPTNMTINCESEIMDQMPTVKDDCSENVTIELMEETASEDCSDGRTITRIWTATDACGNMSMATQVLTVIDDMPPYFLYVPTNVTINCGDDLPMNEEPITKDDCIGEVMVTLEETNSGDCTNGKLEIIRTWTATDICGNMATATQTITIIDNTPPYFSFIPSNVTVNCDDMLPMEEPTVADDCSPNVHLTVSETTGNGDCSSAMQITRTWTATDDCGNSATATQVLYIKDETPPTITFTPEDATYECGTDFQILSPTAVDNCGGEVLITLSTTNELGDCPNNFTIKNTWTISDICGNSVQTTQTITIYDTEAPTFSNVPPDLTVQCDAIPEPAHPQATDFCTPNVDITFTETIDGVICTHQYSIIRTWTATDPCGNSTQVTQVITVLDTTPPVFDNIPSASISINLVLGDIIPPVPYPIASDNCDDAVDVSFYERNEYVNCGYNIIRTWTATDDCGNYTEIEQIIHVSDELSLTIDSIINESCDGGDGSISISVSGGSQPYTYQWSNGQTSSHVTNLSAGDYSLTVTDDQGCTAIISATITAPSPQDCGECDINIGDYVWLDANSNGLQDDGEYGINGVKVNLIAPGPDGEFNTADDIIVDMDMTDNTGHYLFECVEPGTYIIEFFPLSLPDNATFTEQDAGNDDLDSDANPITGQTDPFTIVEGQDDDLSFDAGIIYECLNVITGGEICCDQEICGAGGIADKIESISPASGGFGPVEYLWMISTSGAPFDIDSPEWNVIPGATDECYEPGAIYQTTYIIRCARSEGCENYVGETNIIKLVVVSPPSAEIVQAPQEICTDEPASFAGVVTSLTSTFSWTFEGATPETTNTALVDGIVWENPGVYQVTLIVDDEGCSSSSSTTIEVLDCSFEFIMQEAIAMDEETSVMLEWEVIRDEPEAAFIIERSRTGEEFHFVHAMLGNGDGHSQQTYSFVDTSPRIGYNHYRIKYFPNSSNIEFSEEMEVLLRAGNTKRTAVTPNPFRDHLMIEVFEQEELEGTLQVVDALGRILSEYPVQTSNHQIHVNLKELTAGFYFIRIKLGKYRAETHKVIKAIE